MRRAINQLLLAIAVSPMLVVIALASTLVTVVPPTKRFSKHVLFVCDVSGSMSGRPFSKALGAVKMIASQPCDDMEIGIISFADSPLRWCPNVKAKDKEKRIWAELPDAKAVKKGGQWLKLQGANGGTRVIPALELALADPKKNLSIVLVTDGIFMEVDNDVMKAVEKAQKKRVKLKRGRALIAALGVGTKQPILTRLGKTGHGGYFNTPDKDEDPVTNK